MTYRLAGALRRLPPVRAFVAEGRRMARATPVRLAVGMVALFTVVSLAAFGFAYLELLAREEKRIRTYLAQHVAGFQAAGSAEALRDLVAAEAAAADPETRIFVFSDHAGLRIGNAQADIVDGSVRLSRAPGGRSLSDDGYEIETLRVAEGLLVVAESRGDVSDLRETALGLLAASLGPTVLLSLAAALALARASARRVGRIEAMLDRLTAGDLAARVAEPAGRADDLARIGAGLDRMAAAQEASVGALRQVSADIAHDLKTPVQRIGVLLARLRERLPQDGPEADLASRAAEEAERAAAVFQALLRIAQIEGGAARSRFAPVDLGTLAASLADVYGPAAEESGRMLALDAGAGPLVVRGDRDLVGQAIANLLENGLRHTPAGACIVLSVAREGASVVLAVSDDGPGVPEPERELVTRRLYRLERSRTTPGHGLGLSLVAAVAALHEATLTLEDAQPGLRVRLAFPA